MSGLRLPTARLTSGSTDIGGPFGHNRERPYLDLNPNGLIPTIEDGDFVLWESNSIVRYLVDKYGKGALLPPTPESRGDANRWMDWQLTTAAPAVQPVFGAYVRNPERKHDPAALEKALDYAIKAYRMLDSHLTDRPYVAGENLSMGDIPSARQTAADALRRARALRDEWSSAWALTFQGLLDLAQSDENAAAVNFEAALQLRRRLGDAFGEAWASQALASVAMLRGDLADHLRVGHVLEGTRPALHPQVLEAVFGQNHELRWASAQVLRLDAGDAPGEDRARLSRRAEFDRKCLAEGQKLPVEEEEAHLDVLRPPIGEGRLAAKQPQGRLFDHHRLQQQIAKG